MNTNTATTAELIAAIKATNPRPRSQWARAVHNTAINLINETADGFNLDALPLDPAALENLMLNGAQNWQQFSEGGNALIYDEDIAAAYCTPSELKKTRNGRRRPNSSENWIDLQARALYQAARILKDAARHIDATRNAANRAA